jgi:hypothetical protein
VGTLEIVRKTLFEIKHCVGNLNQIDEPPFYTNFFSPSASYVRYSPWVGIPKIRVLGQCDGLSPTSHFGNVPHPWALPIERHKPNIIMNLNI